MQVIFIANKKIKDDEILTIKKKKKIIYHYTLINKVQKKYFRQSVKRDIERNPKSDKKQFFF